MKKTLLVFLLCCFTYTASAAIKDTSVCVGANLSFFAGACNNKTYQWQIKPFRQTGFVNISENTVYGAVTTDSFGINAVTSYLSGARYRYIIAENNSFFYSDTFISPEHGPMEFSIVALQVNLLHLCAAVPSDPEEPLYFNLQYR